MNATAKSMEISKREKAIPFHRARLDQILKSAVVRDMAIALAWTMFVGLPLFTLHMLVLDYEHYQHGMSLQFSFEMSLKNMFSYHPVSIGLWLVAVFAAALSVRVAFRKQREVITMQGIVERSQNDALMDELTGLPNRRAFERMLKSSFDFAKLAHQPLTLVIADVDHFKSINDQFGHLAGDQALRSAAIHLASLVRTGDIVARYGGDEFVIICPGLSPEGASALVNRLYGTTPPTPLELSFGMATYPLNGQTATTIIEVADKNLYQQKRLRHSGMKP